ncbi:hypothetical protein KQI84_13005 [bacterium]|nr:hypothetical protein [bacterium]
MPKTTVLLNKMACQLYSDIRFIAQLNPTQIVDDDTAKMFNSLLAEVRQNFHSVPQVFFFGEMTGRTIKYKDALIVVGQLKSIMEAVLTDEGGVMPPAATPTDKKPKESSNPNDSVHDAELYGHSPPVRVNEDGTIPFSLEEEARMNEE